MSVTKLLVFDTSGELLSAGIFDGDKRVASVSARFFSNRSGALMPAVEKLFKRSILKWADIEAIAVGVGPGSFTGLRVGVMTAKALARLSGKKLIAVDSLEVMARGAGVSDGRVAALRDARKGRVYAALFKFENGRARILEKTALIDREGFLAHIVHPALIVEDAPPQAFAVALAARELIRRGKFVSPERLKPVYLHPKDCNVTLPKK